MRKNLIVILALFSFSCSNRDGKVDKSKLLGNDYRLFQDTPAWILAKAVEDGDTLEIKKQVQEEGINIDFQEPRFGNTLLMMAIVNSEYESAKSLLQLGADPNLENKYRGSTAMIDAANNDNSDYLKLLLGYKGNPNAIEAAPVKDGDMTRETALNKAISYGDINNLEKVKYLVEAGANVNYFNYGNPVYTDLPLADALNHNKMDVVLYLLQKGAKYKITIYRTVDGQDEYILGALRKSVLDLNSTEYQKKLEVIASLKDKGLDYAKEPIPDYVLKGIKKKYPDSWQEYIKKY